MKYRNFITKAVSLFVIVGCVMTTNNYLAQANERKAAAIAEQEEELAKQQEALAKEQGLDVVQYLYKDGSFTGTATGFGGDVTVSVTIKNDKITAIDILSADKEDGAYLDSAMTIVDRILQENSADVDTISGATYSSAGIKNAVILALEEAQQ